MTVLEKALFLEPGHIEAVNSLAFLHEELGQTDQAERYYHQAIRLNPDLASGYYNLGDHFRKTNRFEKAHQTYLKALEIRPFDHDTQYALGYLFYQQGKYPQAMEVFQRVRELKPDARSYQALGLTYQAMGDERKANEFLQKAAELEHAN